jgi:hypothetical protein
VTVVERFMRLARKRGLILVVLSAISALLAAKTGGVHGGGIQQYGFWDGL